ncbi:MAG: hypothetical protein HYZ53_00855 [Planctomycetes bacterium]|nr:hypothetical protein [Planctomycetota bacterium]
MRSPFPEILCTLGSSTDDPAVLAAMVDAGMGMARINSAYATTAQMAARVEGLRAVSPTPVLLDVKGPQLRLECTTERPDPRTGEPVTVPCSFPISRDELIRVGFGVGPVRFLQDFGADLQRGDRILFENGTIVTEVVEPASEGVVPLPKTVLLRVREPGLGRLSPGMGANVPGRQLHVARLSQRDLEALALGVQRRVEWYALSFVREPEDVANLAGTLSAAGEREAGLVAKIEEASGVARLEEIVEAARATGRPVAVMIARGDLFVELPRARLPEVQSDLVRRCRRLGVPAIVATGLLLSMQRGATPARSEVCDVAAAAREGADSFMLSDETSNGAHPALAVATLADIVRAYRHRDR